MASWSSTAENLKLKSDIYKATIRAIRTGGLPMTSFKAVALQTAAILAISVFGQPPSSAQTLASPTQRVLFDRSAFFGDSTPLPTWSNGLLVSHEVETFQEGAANVRWYDRSGQQIGSASIWFPGSKRVLIYSAVATADGNIIVAGSANKSLDPPVDRATAFSFLAKIDAAGKILKVLPTPGFYSSAICAAPDGTVWSYGNPGFDAKEQPIEANMLRHFDIEKGQLATFLPRSTFGKYPSPTSLPGIACGKDSLAVFASSISRLITLKYDSAAPQIYSVTSMGQTHFSSLAIVGKTVYSAASQGGLAGLYRLSTDDSNLSAKWIPVAGAVGAVDKPGVVGALWGADSTSLIVSESADPAGYQALYWTQPSSN
jgi:hypothetical protein